MSPARAGGLCVSLPSPLMTLTTTSPGSAGRASTGSVLRAVPTRPSSSARVNRAWMSTSAALADIKVAMVRQAARDNIVPLTPMGCATRATMATEVNHRAQPSLALSSLNGVNMHGAGLVVVRARRRDLPSTVSLPQSSVKHSPAVSGSAQATRLLRARASSRRRW